MPIPRRAVARPLGAVTAAALALAGPATPASAGGSACTIGKFTATSQADLAKISVLDPGPLAPDLPALADVRIAPAHGDVTAGRSLATASYTHGELLGLPSPGAVATDRAPGSPAGGVHVPLAALNAGGLASATLGKATAEATWTDRYRCGRTGPLTRATTMVEGLSVLGGTRTVPAIQAVSATQAASRTSLLRVGPTGSTQSATDLVELAGGRIGVRSGAGIALGGLTLFAGTPQEISAKVVTQPTLEVVAGGSRKRSTVTYRPAVLAVTSAGKAVPGLDGDHTSVSLDLLGKMAADRPASRLSVRLSLGSPNQEITDAEVRADAAALRVEVRTGPACLLDVALGHLSVAAAAPGRVGASVPRDQVPADASDPYGSGRGADSPGSGLPGADSPGSDAADADSPGSDVPDADSPGSPSPGSDSRDTGGPVAGEPVGLPARTAPSGPVAAGGNPGSGAPPAGGLALTGANAAAVGLGGLALVVGGLVTLFLTRRRRTGAHTAQR
ncbi:serine/threonine-protein kinase [Actinoplanes siamensis]|uniref:Gram-positive cocci surface proteins LPxTG domain-containing protein n=1 Tax=Actinoplanes siamensis TaxID=1223317 RepID=A0A919N4S4_9ACTN|nr:hypothetical protein [Actinoplanes siamensis]GIF04368.1 hypothetical protein Asi03nite_19060 [Actinoplanes siamensis]